MQYILTYIIQMQNNKNRHSAATSQQAKPTVSRPKPEWTTDFTDYSKYKLSEAEMIQKKAALQSKHREEAKQLVQQRQKKLQMGIIDEDTRKVYETALTSKNIDINPPIRKNLSQMIQYEREIENQKRKEANNDENQNQEDFNDDEMDEDQKKYDNQLKQTQAFIKKFERAKKQDKIQRAINILEADQSKKQKHKPQIKQHSKPQKSKAENLFENQKLKNQNILDSRNMSMNQSNEEALSSIEETIKFMEERLFSGKRASNIQKQVENQSIIPMQSPKIQFKQQTFSLSHQNESYIEGHSKHFHEDMLQLSQLRMNQSHAANDDDDECMDTIRRMREMIESKEHLYSNLDNSKRQKQNIRVNSQRMQESSRMKSEKKYLMDSDAEVDFSLTNNSVQIEQHLNHKNSECYSGNFGKTAEIDLYDDEYQKIKKSLFEEVNRLQVQSGNSIDQTSFQAKTSFNDRSTPNVSEQSNMDKVRDLKYSTIKKPFSKKPNSELQKLKNQIVGTKNTVQNMKIEQLHLPKSTQVIGFDFRGSINIKKNIALK